MCSKTPLDVKLCNPIIVPVSRECVLIMLIFGDWVSVMELAPVLVMCYGQHSGRSCKGSLYKHGSNITMPYVLQTCNFVKGPYTNMDLTLQCRMCYKHAKCRLQNAVILCWSQYMK